MSRAAKHPSVFERAVAWHSRKPWQVHLSLAGFLVLFIVTCFATSQGFVHAQPAPSVNLTAPTDGSTLSGNSVVLSASTAGGTSTALDFVFSDASGTTINATSTDAGVTWTANLDSTFFADGSTTLVASSTIDGVNILSSLVNVTFHNAPTVTIVSPLDGATLTGSSVSLAATTTGGISTALDFVFSDASGTIVNAGTADAGATWTASLNSTLFADGASTLIASSTINGVNVTSTLVNVTFSNGPTVFLTSPNDGATISGNNVALSASTTGGVASAVDFVVNGSASTTFSATTTDVGASWTYSLNSNDFSDGTSTIVASSTINGLNRHSAPISVLVRNGGGGGTGGGLPTVTMLSPLDGANVTSTFQFIAQISNGDAVAVYFTFQGDSDPFTNGLKAKETSPGVWSYIPLDSGYFSDRIYPFEAVAVINGNLVESPVVNLNFAGGFTGSALRILDPSIFGGNNIYTLGIFETRVYGDTPPDGPITFTVDGQPFDPGTSGFSNTFIGDDAGFRWESFFYNPDLHSGPITVVAHMTVNGVPYDSVPYTFNNIGIPQGSILQPHDCAIEQKGTVALSTRVDRYVEYLEYIVTYSYPNNQYPLEEQTTETIQAVYDPSSRTWNANWDTGSAGPGTYTIQAISYDDYGINSFDFGHVSVGLGMQCFFQTPVGSVAPVINFLSPTTNAVATGTIPLIVTSPKAGSLGFDISSQAAGISLHLDATQQADQTWMAQWDTTKEKNGTYIVNTSALDTNNTAFTGDQIFVNVANMGLAAVSSTTATTTFALAATSTLPDSIPNTLSYDPTATGTYSADIALALNPSIDADLELADVSSTSACTAGSLIKLPNDRNPKTTADAAVYYCAQDGQRYLFPNERVFLSWYADFSVVTIVSAAEMRAIPLGGTVPYRPGSRMIKLPFDFKVYAIARGGVLRWVTTEALAQQLYGENWNQKIDDVPSRLFNSYQFGLPIVETTDATSAATATSTTSE